VTQKLPPVDIWEHYVKDNKIWVYFLDHHEEVLIGWYLNNAVHCSGCATPVEVDHIRIVLDDEYVSVTDYGQLYLKKELLSSLMKLY